MDEPTYDPIAASLARELDRTLEVADAVGDGATSTAAHYAGASAVMKMVAAGCTDIEAMRNASRAARAARRRA